MRYFLDTEFYEDGSTLDLISIGVVSEDGREFYACNQNAQLHRVSAWVRQNVLPSLPPYSDPVWLPHNQIGGKILDFCLGVGQEFWAYYGDYDWVAFCQLYGTMMDLPKSFPMFCRDLKQLSCDVGSPQHPPDPVGKHNALVDARWNRDLYRFLQQHRSSAGGVPKLAEEIEGLFHKK